MRFGLALATPFMALWLLSGCQTLSGGVPQAERDFKSDEEFRTWFAFYYKDPHPEFVTGALHFMKSHSYLEDYPDIAGVFLSRVFAANPGSLSGWCEGWAKMGGKEWDVIVLALWLVNTEESKNLATANLDKTEPDHRERLKTMLSREPATVDPLSAEISDARQINLVWAAFSATGDEKYVQKVISYVHLYGEETDPEKAEVGEAAIMTLANNALQHENVARICESQDKENPDPRTRILLKAMLSALAQMAKEGEAPALPTH